MAKLVFSYTPKGNGAVVAKSPAFEQPVQDLRYDDGSGIRSGEVGKPFRPAAESVDFLRRSATPAVSVSRNSSAGGIICGARMVGNLRPKSR